MKVKKPIFKSLELSQLRIKYGFHSNEFISACIQSAKISEDKTFKIYFTGFMAKYGINKSMASVGEEAVAELKRQFLKEIRNHEQIETLLRFENDLPLNLDEIGKVGGLTRERVRQIERDAFKVVIPRTKRNHNVEDYLRGAE